MSDKELNKINSANNEAVLTIEQVKHQLIEQGKKAGHLSHEEIATLEKATEENPGAREAQKRLAEEMTIFVHGEAALAQALKISNALFSGDVKQLTKEE